jgi:hypothetical protein
MSLSLILPLANGAVLRSEFFHSQGVTLESQSRSTSGVRDDDGMVVFAMSLARVRVDPWGCSCQLWAARNGLLEDALSMETLRHCRLAVQHGLAEGFLVGSDEAPMKRQALLALRVVKVGREYWAKWGQVARLDPACATASYGGARFQ